MPAPPVEPATIVVAQRPGRLDTAVLAACPGLSRRLVRRLIDDGAIRVDGRRVARGAHVAAGARVTLPPLALTPEPDLPVRIVHVDARIVVVDKPGAMPGHALDPRQRGTVAAFLAGRFPETATVGDPLASGLAHRLDTGTSGLQIAARTPETYARLRAAFRAGDLTKAYLAIVHGAVPAELHISLALRHDPRDRRRMTAAAGPGRAWPAHTDVRRLATLGDRSLVEARLRSGVTHQVRAHLASRGHPIVGDPLYGGAPGALPPGRHALHAARIVPGGRVGDLPSLESALPADLCALLAGG
jgi:23S rRNA pseudouridine1911/1915/1917 synthase